MARRLNPAALREIRELAGVSQPELAKRAGIEQASLSNIELGKRGASPAVIRRLAVGLKCSVDAISISIPDPEPEAAAS